MRLSAFGIFVVLFVLVCAIVIVPVAAISVRGVRDEVFPADVAVVPATGSGMNFDGTPKPRLASRLDRARELFRDRMCRVIFVSGEGSVGGRSVADAMKSYLVEKGVPTYAVDTDGTGAHTRATAEAAARFMRDRGFESAIAVTSFYHVARFVSALKSAGVEQVGSAHASGFEVGDIWHMFREMPAVFAYSMGFR